MRSSGSVLLREGLAQMLRRLPLKPLLPCLPFGHSHSHTCPQLLKSTCCIHGRAVHSLDLTCMAMNVAYLISCGKTCMRAHLWLWPIYGAVRAVRMKASMWPCRHPEGTQMLAKVRGWPCQWPVAVWSLKLCLRKDMEQVLESHKPGGTRDSSSQPPHALSTRGSISSPDDTKRATLQWAKSNF